MAYDGQDDLGGRRVRKPKAKPKAKPSRRDDDGLVPSSKNQRQWVEGVKRNDDKKARRAVDAYLQSVYDQEQELKASNAAVDDPFNQLLAMLKPVDPASYTAPYDQAATSAKAAFAALTPTIESGYANLGSKLAAGAADTQQQFQGNRADLVKQFAQTRGEMDQFAAQAQANPHVTDPTLQTEAGAQTAALQAAQSQSSDSRLALADRFAQIQGQSDAGRQSDVGVAKEAALANASTNLQGLLNKIGLARADAARQGAAASENRAMDIYKLKADHEADKASSAATQAQENAKLFEQAMVSPSEDFMANYSMLADKFPNQVRVFEEITKAAKGKGQQGLTAARRLLQQAAPYLQEGKYELEDGTKINSRLSVDRMNSWLEDYYDTDSKRVSERKLQELLALREAMAGFGG
jgi:hypothetical protein